jgi:NADH-quinone oxidoreductase subunit E
MAVRRLADTQPADFAFTPANLKWAKTQIAKFPKGREASAVIPLLWRAQEQHEGWLPEPALRYVGDMLGMPYIRVLEVATFYTMYQLQPVGKKAHVQVCGTTPCMLRGSGDLIKVCKSKIARNPHELSEDGNFSWEEVECLGACVNAPMVQIFKDTYEDLTVETFEKLLSDIDAGKPVTPGPQNGRHFSVAEGGATTLTELDNLGPMGSKPIPHVVNGAHNAIKDEAGIAINGGGQPEKADISAKPAAKKPAAEKSPSKAAPVPTPPEYDANKKAKPEKSSVADNVPSLDDAARPQAVKLAKGEKADDLKAISGIGPVLEKKLHDLGVFKFAQIASWTTENIEWADGYLRFKGRIVRDNWL